MKARQGQVGLRLTCGLALLLLPAAQHKFAPKSADEVRLRPRAALSSADGDSHSVDERHRTKTRLALAVSVPDVALSRWPCPFNVSTAEEDAPRSTVPAGGEVGPRLRSAGDGDASDFAPLWVWVPPSRPLIVAQPFVDPELARIGSFDHVRAGCILRTGPPLV